MAKLKVVNPATGKVAASLDADDAKSVKAKYERARAAQARWVKVPLKKRLAAIAAFREKIVAETEHLAGREVPCRQRKGIDGVLRIAAPAAGKLPSATHGFVVKR